MSEELKARYDALREQINSLREQVKFEDLRQTVADLGEQISETLPTALDSVRQRGYKYRGHIDSGLETLTEDFLTLRAEAEQALRDTAEAVMSRVSALRGPLKQAAASLESADAEAQAEADAAEDDQATESTQRLSLRSQREAEEDEPGKPETGSRLSGRFKATRARVEAQAAERKPTRRLSLRRDDDEAEVTLDAAAEPTALLAQVESVVGSLADQVKGFVEEPVSELKALEEQARTYVAQLNLVSWSLDQLDDSELTLNADEALVLAAKAEWVETGKAKDDPDGILYLTDSRLIFEQKEKVGKRMGMFGGKEVQGIVWEFPVHLIETIQAENKGMLGGKDMLHLSLGAGAPHAQITLEVKGGADNDAWLAEIDAVKSGAIRETRVD